MCSWRTKTWWWYKCRFSDGKMNFFNFCQFTLKIRLISIFKFEKLPTFHSSASAVCSSVYHSHQKDFWILTFFILIKVMIVKMEIFHSFIANIIIKIHLNITSFPYLTVCAGGNRSVVGCCCVKAYGRNGGWMRNKRWELLYENKCSYSTRKETGNDEVPWTREKRRRRHTMMWWLCMQIENMGHFAYTSLHRINRPCMYARIERNDTYHHNRKNSRKI